ncbi:MAG: fluoride efflux transporter CrcB [Oxalobacteraceae bacterium]|jgi:CrcB protein|nr:MAG: fluoride efflux transporter CrcB [Oxalobacteraceae bacterium]
MNRALVLSIGVICVGASTGALLRWALGVSLNAMFPLMPLGTWFANLLGGFLVGFAVTYFTQHAQLSVEWRLLVITGFLGGLTTFSTFSAEVAMLISQGQMRWAALSIAAHVGGSLLLTFLGMATASRFTA